MSAPRCIIVFLKHFMRENLAAAMGLDAALFFVIQMEGVRSLSPNDDTHPAFGAALREAAAAGVRVLACDCRVTPESLTLRSPVPVIL